MSAAGSNPAPSADPAEQLSCYHLDRAALVLALGVLATACGCGVLGVVAVAAQRDGSAAWTVGFWALLTLTTIAAVLLSLVTVRLLRRRPALVLDGSGYRVHGVRGSGVQAAAWHDVAEVVTASGALRLRLRDGRSTTLPVRLIDEPATIWLSDIRERVRHAQRGQPLR